MSTILANSLYFLIQPPDFTYPRLVTLEITVHQLILTYDTSKSLDLRRASIRRFNSYAENDNPEENEKLEVCGYYIMNTEMANFYYTWPIFYMAYLSKKRF